MDFHIVTFELKKTLYFLVITINISNSAKEGGPIIVVDGTVEQEM